MVLLEPFIIITQLMTALAAFAAFGVSLHNARQIRTVEHATNSLLDRMIIMTARAAHAEGVKDEKERAGRGDAP